MHLIQYTFQNENTEKYFTLASLGNWFHLKEGLGWWKPNLVDNLHVSAPLKTQVIRGLSDLQ